LRRWFDTTFAEQFFESVGNVCGQTENGDRVRKVTKHAFG
jgi:hypothetical protein